MYFDRLTHVVAHCIEASNVINFQKRFELFLQYPRVSYFEYIMYDEMIPFRFSILTSPALIHINLLYLVEVA